MGMTAAERQRNYRERVKARAVAAGDVTGNGGNASYVTPRAPAPTVMRDSVSAALEAMQWLRDSDGAAVQQAKLLAEDVDELRHDGETTKALSAQRALTKVLNDLGGTPTVRMQQELRSLRAQGGDPKEPDDNDDRERQSGNVSQFQRPAGRRAG